MMRTKYLRKSLLRWNPFGAGAAASAGCATAGAPPAIRLTPSPDDPVGAHQDRVGDLDTHRACGRLVHPELEARGLLDRQLGGPRALRDTVYVVRRSAKAVTYARAVGDETAVLDELMDEIHHRNPVAQGKLGQEARVGEADRESREVDRGAEAFLLHVDVDTLEIRVVLGEEALEGHPEPLGGALEHLH